MKQGPHGKLIPENMFESIGLHPEGVSAGIRAYTTLFGLPFWECPRCGGLSSFEAGGGASHKCPWQIKGKSTQEFYRRGIESLFAISLNP
jgi:hypothetical protein